MIAAQNVAPTTAPTATTPIFPTSQNQALCLYSFTVQLQAVPSQPKPYRLLSMMPVFVLAGQVLVVSTLSIRRSCWLAAPRTRGSGCSRSGAMYGRDDSLGERPLRQPSAELLGQCDDDALGAADVTEPIAVLVLLQLADEFGRTGPAE